MNLIIGCLCNLCYHSSLKQWSLCWSEKKTHSPSNPCQTSTLLVCPTCSTVFLHYTFYFLFTSCYVLRCCLWVERHTVHALRLLLWPCNHGGNPQLGGAQNFYRERKNRLLCLSPSLSLSVSVSLSLSLCPCLSVSLSLHSHTHLPVHYLPSTLTAFRLHCGDKISIHNIIQHPAYCNTVLCTCMHPQTHLHPLDVPPFLLSSILQYCALSCLHVCTHRYICILLMFLHPLVLQVTLYRKMPLKAISRLWGRFNQIELPVFLRRPLLSLYIWMFGCRLDEAEVEDLRHYKNLGEFFRRELKPHVRPIDDDHVLVSHASVGMGWVLSLIHIWRCRREWSCRSRWSPYH